MVIIDGYKVNSNSPEDIELILGKIQAIIKERATAMYHTQLSKEIEILVDDIALNIQPRPSDISILDAARAILNMKIAYATAKNNPTQYNYFVSVNVMYSGEKTYIKFNSENNIYKKQLQKIEELVPFSMDDKDAPLISAEREGVWKALMEKYSRGVQPLSAQLFPIGEFELNEKALKFSSPNKRAQAIARHNLTNKYISMFAQENEIPNFKLMEYMDEALLLLSEPKGKEELELLTNDLKQKNLLPNITLAIITRDPNEEAEKTLEPNGKGA